MRKTRSKSRRARRVTRKRGGNGLWESAKKCIGNTCFRQKHDPNLIRISELESELEKCHRELAEVTSSGAAAYKELQGRRPPPSRRPKGRSYENMTPEEQERANNAEQRAANAMRKVTGFNPVYDVETRRETLLREVGNSLNEEAREERKRRIRGY